MLTADTM